MLKGKTPNSNYGAVDNNENEDGITPLVDKFPTTSFDVDDTRKCSWNVTCPESARLPVLLSMFRYQKGNFMVLVVHII